MSDKDTRGKARKAIQTGTLPNRSPDRMWGGQGAGVDCPLCGARVKRDEVEYEIEFAEDGDDPGPGTYHVHIRCFAAWELELQNLDCARRISSGRQTQSATRASMAGGRSEQG